MGILTLIIGGILGYFFNLLSVKISFKHRTIDNKIKVYDSLIANWVEIRNLIYRDQIDCGWLQQFDNLYGKSQLFIGESFLLSDDHHLLEDINNFNEKFVIQDWSKLTKDQTYTIMKDLKIEALDLIKKMKADIHESTTFTKSDILQIFKGSLD